MQYARRDSGNSGVGMTEVDVVWRRSNDEVEDQEQKQIIPLMRVECEHGRRGVLTGMKMPIVDRSVDIQTYLLR